MREVLGDIEECVCVCVFGDMEERECVFSDMEERGGVWRHGGEREGCWAALSS